MTSGVEKDETTYEGGIANKLSCKPQERFFEVVVGFGGNIVILKVLLAMESDRLRLDFPLLHVDFVTTQNNRDVLANADKVAYIPRYSLVQIVLTADPSVGRRTVPVGNIFVGDPRSNVKHDNTTLAVDIIAVSEAAKLLLAGSVPDVKLNVPKILPMINQSALGASIKSPRDFHVTHRRKAQRVNFHAECCHVLLFKFASQVAFNKRSLGESGQYKRSTLKPLL